MKTMLTDWRGAGKWTRADRNRPCEAASISAQWQHNPFGMRPVEVYVGVQPGILRWEDRPAGTTLDRAIAASAAKPLRTPAGEEVLLWEVGPQDVLALDLTDEGTRAALADAWTSLYPWANLHLDYYSTWVGGKTGSFPLEFWRTWQDGWLDLVSRIRAARPGIKLLGQEWHTTPLSPAVDGQFYEMHPQHFGKTMAWHDANTPRRPADVWEIREPARLPAWYVTQCLRWIEGRGARVSFGRDASAGVGLAP